jgi:heme iron utilization protein
VPDNSKSAGVATVTDANAHHLRAAAATEARALVASANTAALATVDLESRSPYVSLIAIAVVADAPVLLLSTLARHTRNVLADPRASLLLTTAVASGDPSRDPLAAPRVSLMGRIVAADAAVARAGYLKRHPQAAGYADFADFAFYRFEIASAHFIGGFGRIIELSRDDVSA